MFVLKLIHLCRLKNSQQEPIFSVELVEDNLFEWYVKVYKLDDDSDLMQDMVELGIRYILLHLIFPDNFPFAPPFMRLISPRIEKGFIMEGTIKKWVDIKYGFTPTTTFRWGYLYGTTNTSRLGFSLHSGSGNNAICCQCSQRTGQDSAEN